MYSYCPASRTFLHSYQNQAKSYTEITVTGEDAQHSDLPTNDEVVDLVKQHIEGQGVRKEQKTKLEPQ